MAPSYSSKAGSRFRWWGWLFLPFAVIAGVVVFVGVAVGAAVMLPLAVLKDSFRQRRITRRLRADGREIDFAIAVRQCSAGDSLLIAEIGPKGPHDLWLVEPDPADQGCFDAWPTYAAVMADPRAALDSLRSLEPEIVDRVAPYLRTAKRVSFTFSELESLSDDLKSSMRVFHFVGPPGPSSYLNESIG